MSSSIDPALIGACALIAVLIALPALGAASRRRQSREMARVATGFMEFALAVRRTGSRMVLDDALLSSARRLAIPELLSFEFILAASRTTPELLADAAQRLGLRLKRRVAFERKMLARTAAGRGRGSLTAAVPAIALLILAAVGMALPGGALLCLLLLEALGCWLLWQAARVEV
jgi:Flp pilus assembly protein TadB